MIRKGKGRICVDCTNVPDNKGSPNHFIPSPNLANADECPPVFYGADLPSYLLCLWHMRIVKPHEDILQQCDDTDAAFRRIIYHPDLVVTFAYVFSKFLIVLVGQVFGSRSASSYFSLTSNIRNYTASTQDLVVTNKP